MALPAAVQRQIDEADRLEAGLTAPKDSVTTEPEQKTDPQPEPKPVDSPPAQPSEDLTQRITELERQLDSARVEQGRVRSLTKKLEDAQARIEELQRKPEPKPEPPTPVKDGVRAELVDQYGEELVSYMEQFATNAVNPLRSDIQKLSSGVEQVNTTQTMTRQQMFMADVLKAHPDFEQLQSTQLGQQFLLSAIPYGNGKTFDDLLQQAAGSFNAALAIDVFGGMKDHINKNKVPDPKDKLKGQVMPSPGAVGQEPNQQNKPTISVADYKRAELDYVKGKDMTIPNKYGAKTMDEWDAIVREAMNEGRLR